MRGLLDGLDTSEPRGLNDLLLEDDSLWRERRRDRDRVDATELIVPVPPVEFDEEAIWIEVNGTMVNLREVALCRKSLQKDYLLIFILKSGHHNESHKFYNSAERDRAYESIMEILKQIKSSRVIKISFGDKE